MSTPEPPPVDELSEKGHALAEVLGRCAPGGDEAPLAATIAAAISTQLGQAGARVGRFTALRRLGGGALGVVYAGFDPDMNREVAIKILGRSTDNGKLRLWREALALSAIAHPNVLAVYEVGWIEGTTYLATELAPHGTLADWLSVPRSIASVLERFSQIGHGLAAVHAHRDVKPANLFMGKDGCVLVGDFGLVARVGTRGPAAASSARHRADLTVDGAAVGTPGYAAPEQWAGRPVDFRADQYALAVSLARALWGPSAPADQVVGMRPMPPARSGEQVPPDLVSALRRGLSARPEDRYDGVLDMVAELERIGDRLLARRAARITAAALAVPVLGALAWLLTGVARW